MRKNTSYIAGIIKVIMICGMCLIFYAALKGYVSNQQMKKVAEINLQVYHMLDYGDMSGDINEVIASGQGHCGHYTAIMAYKLKERGIDCDIYGLQSTSFQANHSVIECSIAGKRYVFDPTNALYYKNSIQELIECPELAKNAVCQSERAEILLAYTEPYFWAGIYYASRVCDLVHISGDGYNTTHLKNLTTNILLLSAQGEELDLSMLTDNDWKTALTISEKKKIEIQLDLEKDIYGILAIDSIRRFDAIKNIEIVCHDVLTDTWNHVSNTNNNMSHFEFYLGDKCLDQINIQIESNDFFEWNEIVLTGGISDN